MSSKLNRKQRAKIHKQAHERTLAMLNMLEEMTPGDAPNCFDTNLICRDMEFIAKYLRKSFET